MIGWMQIYREEKTMKKIIYSAATAALLFAAPAFASEGCDSGEVVIKFSHDVAETHPKGVAAKQLAERINKEMDGKACMEVYPNSTFMTTTRSRKRC